MKGVAGSSAGMLDVRGSTYRTDKQYMLLGLRGKQRCFIRASGSATIEDITWLVVDKEGVRHLVLVLGSYGLDSRQADLSPSLLQSHSFLQEQQARICRSTGAQSRL